VDVRKPHLSSLTPTLACADINSVAEITSGIICNCLITMPSFFRHIAPIIASKLSLSCGGNHSPNVFSFVPERARPPEWDCDSEALTGKQFEMGPRQPRTAVLHDGDDMMERDLRRGGSPVVTLPANVTVSMGERGRRTNSLGDLDTAALWE